MPSLVDDNITTLSLSGGSGDRVEHSTLGALTVGGSIGNASVVNNQINGAVTISGTSGLILSGNKITGGITSQHRLRRHDYEQRCSAFNGNGRAQPRDGLHRVD